MRRISSLKLLNEKIQRNNEGHPEMLLPFWERRKLLHNKQLATVWLKRFKIKMEKNLKYKEDYMNFMAGVFEDGEAEEANYTPKESNTKRGHTKSELDLTALRDLKVLL